MADQVKQLAFKQFTDAEIEAGTRWDALTTNGTTHYVIKSIEGTQGYNAEAIEATATIGLTTDFNNGKYASLGVCAKKDRVGLSGSAIMDADSTLSIRPKAATISYRDQRFQLSRANSNNNMNQWQQHNKAFVNNVEDSINQNTYINNSSVTHSTSRALYTYVDNYVVYHTNGNGINLAIYFFNNSSNTVGFSLLNADTGSEYGFYDSTYGTPHFDGERYIYFMRGGSYDHQISFFDLDKSDLTPSATQGGASGSGYFHGAYVYSGNQQISLQTTYDNRRTFFYYDRYLNKKFLGYNSNNDQRFILYEIPVNTPTHDYSNTGEKWIWLAHSTHTGGTDPFGNAGNNCWNLGRIMASYTGSAQVHMKMTYDATKARYYIFAQDASRIYPFTFTRAEYDATATASLLNQGAFGYGLYLIAAASAGDAGFNTTIYTDFNSGNGAFDFGTMSSNIGGFTIKNDWNKYYEGLKLYTRTYSSNYQLYEVDLTAATAVKVDTGMTDSESLTNFSGSFWMGWAVPTATQKATRTYNIAPKLSVRISGILSDQ
tara:strand:+ start:2781 stop:4412 length:1632 start_codon:yes stop_codon:yes gene_type:complete